MKNSPKNMLMSCKKIHLYLKMCLDSTFSGLKVSLYLCDLEMNWTASVLVQSDKLAIVLHLLLTRVSTVVKPFQQNRSKAQALDFHTKPVAFHFIRGPTSVRSDNSVTEALCCGR